MGLVEEVGCELGWEGPAKRKDKRGQKKELWSGQWGWENSPRNPTQSSRDWGPCKGSRLAAMDQTRQLLAKTGLAASAQPDAK